MELTIQQRRKVYEFCKNILLKRESTFGGYPFLCIITKVTALRLFGDAYTLLFPELQLLKPFNSWWNKDDIESRIRCLDTCIELTTMPRIQNVELTMEHIGSPVTYIPPHVENMDAGHPDAEHGHISSFNATTIWVRFKAQNGAACPADRLLWS